LKVRAKKSGHLKVRVKNKNKKLNGYNPKKLRIGPKNFIGHGQKI
jgi:hypothetical protein